MSLDGKQISELARVTSVRDDSLLVVDNGGTESNSVYVSDLLKKAGNDKQDKLTAGENIVINDNVISAPTINARNIGEIVPSVLPLTDAGLHLLDGSLIPGNGIYGEFVDYVAGLYNDNPNANYFSQTSTIYNYKKVGTIYDTDGVLSGLAYGNYARTPDMLNLGTANSWEIVTKHYITSVGSVNDGMMGILGGAYNVNYYINASNLITVELSSNGSSYNIGNISMLNAVTLNTFFYVKLEFTGTAYNLYYSTDGTNYTLQGSITSSTKVGSRTNYFAFGVDEAGNHSAWTGKVDMNGCYININGERWWTGYTTFNPEEWWQYLVTTYDSCGKFVYDSVNNTVRLPKISGFVEGTQNINTLGDLVEAGLPNITGGFRGTGQNSSSSDSYERGAFKAIANGTGYSGASGNDVKTWDFDASRSSSIYGNSNTVQPQSIKVLLYIVIANSSRNEIGISTEKNIVDNNLKADKDFSNVVKPNQNFIQKSISWGIPDYNRGITLNYDTLQNFKAPSAGIICGMINPAGSVSGRVYVNGHMVWGGDTYVMSLHIILDRNDVVTHSGIDNDQYNKYFFYPFKGAY